MTDQPEADTPSRPHDRILTMRFYPCDLYNLSVLRDHLAAENNYGPLPGISTCVRFAIAFAANVLTNQTKKETDNA